MSLGGDAAGPDAAARHILEALERSLGITKLLWELLAPGAAAGDPAAHARALETAFARLQEQAGPPWTGTWTGAGPGSGLGLEAWLNAAMQFDWPALGLARERQEQAQRLARAARDVSQAQLRLALVWNQVIREALQALAEKVAAGLAQGRTVASPRALYDLWIECGEAAFARHAHSGEFAGAQGALADASSALRIEQRGAVESWARELDLPTRDELNSVHLRLKSLREEVRTLRRELAEAGAHPASAPRKTAGAPRKPAGAARKPRR